MFSYEKEVKNVRHNDRIISDKSLRLTCRTKIRLRHFGLGRTCHLDQESGVAYQTDALGECGNLHFIPLWNTPTRLLVNSLIF